MAKFEKQQNEPQERISQCVAHGCNFKPSITHEGQTFCRFHFGKPFKEWGRVNHLIAKYAREVAAYNLLLTNSSVDWECGDLRQKLEHLVPAHTDEKYKGYRERVLSMVHEMFFKNAPEIKRDAPRPNNSGSVGDILGTMDF